MAVLDLGKGQHPLLRREFLAIGNEMMDRDHTAVITYMQRLQTKINAVQAIVLTGARAPESLVGDLKCYTVKFLRFARMHFDREDDLARRTNFPWTDIEIEAHKILGGIWWELPDLDFAQIWKRLPRVYEQTMAHGLRGDKALHDWEECLQVTTTRLDTIAMWKRRNPEGISALPKGFSGIPIHYRPLSPQQPKSGKVLVLH